jgi:hypothetical protein
MAAEKREKIKLMLVIGLSVVFVAIAYFRFMPRKGSSAVAAPAAFVADPQVAMPRVEIKNRQIDPAPTSSDAVMRRFVKRDIFAPLNIPLPEKVEKNPSGQKPAMKPPPEPASRPAFIFGGTIVGGDKPIAIINNHFVHTGDSISGFKVVRIGKFEVQLASKNKTIRLEMIENE